MNEDNKLKLDLSALDVAALQAAVNPPESLFKTTMYRNAQDRIIEIWEEVEDDGSVKAGGLRRYYAPINVTLNTPMGPQPLALHIPLETSTLREAFGIYEEQVPKKAEEAVRAEIEKLKKRIQEEHRKRAGGLVLPTMGG